MIWETTLTVTICVFNLAKNRSVQSYTASYSTLGIIGFGNIGKAVAEKAKGFNMKILYYSRTRKEDQEKCLGKVS